MVSRCLTRKRFIKVVNPTLEEFKQLAKQGNLIAVTTELVADEETPVSAFRKLSQGQSYTCILESVEGGEHLGRYSFLTFNPRKVIKGNSQKQDPLEVLKSTMSSFKAVPVPGLPRFWGGAIGYIAYDVIMAFERLPQKLSKDINVPDYFFLLTDSLLIFDHFRHTMLIVVGAFVKHPNQAPQAYKKACRTIAAITAKLKRQAPRRVQRKKSYKIAHVTSNVTKENFMRSVERAKEYIRAGDIIQVVLSQRFTTEVDVSDFDIYRALRLVNPSPYMYFMQFKTFSIIGSSPEILVRKEGMMAETRPIAGTRPRGRHPEEDIRLERELREDPKERAEHLMLVDLGRNDLGRVCEYGSVQMEEFMTVERYSHVMHLESTVKGRLKPPGDAYDLFKACFPAGTVTGAPKIRAMEIIEELESVKRGPYAGALGYFSYTGNMDMAITIRTMVMQKKRVYVQAGAGIVADSVPEKEYEETKNKAAALFAAIERAQKGL